MVAEGLETSLLTKEIYIRRSIKDLLHGDGVAWMYDAILFGLNQVLSSTQLDQLRVSHLDLRIITCGAPDT